MLEIKIPTVGESITEVRLSRILKKENEYAAMDEILAELESEKATFEILAEKAGTVHWKAKEGDDLKIGDIICTIDIDATAPAKAAPTSNVEETKPEAELEKKAAKAESTKTLAITPLAKKIVEQENIPIEKLPVKKGKITKQDAINASKGILPTKSTSLEFSRENRMEKMTPLRKTISKKLVLAKNSTAMLTTFNEVDMQPIMDLRKIYKDKFKEIHAVNLGFMSFFIKACCHALQAYPSVNAQIEEDMIRYYDYCDISIAVSTPKGLVVPIIRNAESKDLAELERDVAELALKGRDNKLSMEDMTGGTFTISNGGVFGSLMSTPIINAPQSAILGMHKIQERPMAINGQVVIKPMMYLALSYDHRIIDGKESVGFLVKVKELLENPNALLFGEDPLKILLGV